MGHFWEGTNIRLLMEEVMSCWFSSQADISQMKTVATYEEGETQMVVEINIIKGETLRSCNRTLMEEI